MPDISCKKVFNNFILEMTSTEGQHDHIAFLSVLSPAVIMETLIGLNENKL
jgi:hypothetical protein